MKIKGKVKKKLNNHQGLTQSIKGVYYFKFFKEDNN